MPMRAPRPARPVEAQRATHARAEAVGADDEPPRRSSPPTRRPTARPSSGALDGRVFEDAHAGRGARRRDERLVEAQAALREHRRGGAVDVREGLSAESPKPW